MITTTSSSNGNRRLNGLFFSIIRRYVGVTILYSILQFIFFPLQYILTASNALKMIREGGPDNTNYQYLYGFSGIHNGISVSVLMFMLISVPILFTLMQFSYLHQKRSTDMYHSLPVRREKLLLVNFGASMAMFGVPLIVNYFITIIAGFAFGFKEFSAVGSIVELLFHLIMAAAITAITVLVCVLSGTIFDSFVYTIGALYALPLILFIIFLDASRTLYGFTVPDWTQYITYLSPGVLPIYIQAISWSIDDFTNNIHTYILAGAAIWMIFTAAVLYAAIVCYRRRKSELAGKTGFDTSLTIFIKLAGTFAGAFFFSFLIEATTTSDNVVLLTISSLVGGALTYCIIECILARGFKTMKKSFSKIVAGMVIPAVFVLILGTGGLGYEERVPNAEKIKQITLEFSDRYGIPRYDMNEARKQLDRKGTNRYLSSIWKLQLEQVESFEAVTDLHRQIVTNIDGETWQRTVNDEFVPNYTLNGGMKQSRRYYAFSQLAQAAYDRLNALQEIKEQTHPIYSFNAQEIRDITLLNIPMTSITPASLNEQEIQQIIEAIRKDMTAETYEQMVSAKPLGYIVLTPNYDNNYYYDWTQSLVSEISSKDVKFFDCYVLLTEAYTNTLSLLQSLSYENFGEINSKAISKVYVRLEETGRSSNCLRINGPSSFIPNDYMKADDETIKRYFDGGRYNEFTDSSAIQTFCSLVDPYSRNSVAPVQFDQESKMLWYWGGTGVTISFCFVSENGLYQKFNVNPLEVPQDLLYQLKENFNMWWEEKRWAETPEDPFEDVMKAIQRANDELLESDSDTIVAEAR